MLVELSSVNEVGLSLVSTSSNQLLHFMTINCLKSISKIQSMNPVFAMFYAVHKLNIVERGCIKCH